MKRIAIIPARSGSKGVPDKNILEICGKPLMVWTIENAVESKLFDHIIVSTDSEKYAEIAGSAGAEVVMRPPEFATDTASSYSVIKHVLESQNHLDADWFMLLQVTSLMRTTEQIVEAAELFESNMHRDDVDYVVSVCEVERGVSFEIDDGTLKNFDLSRAQARRQDVKEKYRLNGAIYISEPNKYIESGHFYGPTSLAYKMDSVSSVDIDDWIDFELAKILMQKRLDEKSV